MNVIQKTDNLMVAKEDPQLFAIAVTIILILAGIVGFVSPSIVTPPMPAWTAILLLLVGIFIATNTQIITITIDKNLNKFILSKQSIIGNKKDEYSFNQIMELQIRQTVHTDRPSRSHTGTGSYTRYARTHTVTSLYLILKDGKEIFIISGNVPAQEMAVFMGVPFRGYGTPTVPESLTPLTPQVGMEKSPLEKIEKPPNPENR